LILNFSANVSSAFSAEETQRIEKFRNNAQELHDYCHELYRCVKSAFRLSFRRARRSGCTPRGEISSWANEEIPRFGMTDIVISF
jgi:hypothetical protein